MGFDQANEAVKLLAQKEGVGVGGILGSRTYGSYSLAMREENADKNIVTLFPDGAERYLTS